MDSGVSALRAVTLAVRFVCELSMLAALAYGGGRSRDRR
jgi:hypothetical protein